MKLYQPDTTYNEHRRSRSLVEWKLGITFLGFSQKMIMDYDTNTG